MTEDYVIPDLHEATIRELLQGLDKGHFTVVQLVSTYIDRIGEVNTVGPHLRAVLEINAAALQQAARCDQERREAATDSSDARLSNLGILHGIPILVKDNIATASPIGWDERLNTTAGSLALQGCYPSTDATVIRKLREAGAIIMGKTNMSEWANWRGEIPSGWSSVGGQCTNPYYPGATPSGSSAGSAVAATLGLAAATLGTETDGSIIYPSSWCNIVGMKPTVGLTSRVGVIPISKSQDSVGPMCRTISDVAFILQAISGPDEQDPPSESQPPVPDYLSVLKSNFIKGKRIGVLRGFHMENTSMKDTDRDIMACHVAAFEEALIHLQKLGAEVIDPVEIDTAKAIWGQREKEWMVFRTEFKIGLAQYLEQLPDTCAKPHSLRDVIAFNRAHPESHFKGEENQHILIWSDEMVVDETYQEALKFCRVKGCEEGIDACLKKHQLDLLVTPLTEHSTYISAVAGYPILTVPLGFLPDTVIPEAPTEGFPALVAPGLPFGIVIMGGKWSERTLLGCGYALEQSMGVRAQRRPVEDAIPKSQLPGFLPSRLKDYTIQRDPVKAQDQTS